MTPNHEQRDALPAPTGTQPHPGPAPEVLDYQPVEDEPTDWHSLAEGFGFFLTLLGIVTLTFVVAICFGIGIVSWLVR